MGQGQITSTMPASLAASGAGALQDTSTICYCFCTAAAAAARLPGQYCISVVIAGLGCHLGLVSSTDHPSAAAAGLHHCGAAAASSPPIPPPCLPELAACGLRLPTAAGCNLVPHDGACTYTKNLHKYAPGPASEERPHLPPPLTHTIHAHQAPPSMQGPLLVG